MGADPTRGAAGCYALRVSAESTERATSPEGGIYAEFDAFLKQAIREYYDRGWKSRKGNFIALLIAAGQTTFAMAKDSVVDGSGTKKVAIGAAAVVALQVGLRFALGGPLGMILGVAAGASMISYFIRNQKDIIKKVSVYRVTIAETHKAYDAIHGGWRDGKHGPGERNLMIDGLMKRFIGQIDEA